MTMIRLMFLALLLPAVLGAPSLFDKGAALKSKVKASYHGGALGPVKAAYDPYRAGVKAFLASHAAAIAVGKSYYQTQKEWLKTGVDEDLVEATVDFAKPLVEKAKEWVAIHVNEISVQCAVDAIRPYTPLVAPFVKKGVEWINNNLDEDLVRDVIEKVDPYVDLAKAWLAEDVDAEGAAAKVQAVVARLKALAAKYKPKIDKVRNSQVAKDVAACFA